jgi:hypothetical protein
MLKLFRLFSKKKLSLKQETIRKFLTPGSMNIVWKEGAEEIEKLLMQEAQEKSKK